MSKATDHLRDHQQQLDEDGVMVGVSRQAVVETLAEIEQLREALRELHAVVRGECSSLLDEDSGGDARLDLLICELIDPNAHS